MKNHFQPEDIIAYVDGLCKKKESQSIHSHLETCPTCLEAVEDLRFLREKVKRAMITKSQLQNIRIPESLSIEMDRMTRELLGLEVSKIRRRPWSFLKRLFLPIAAGILFLLAVVFFTRPREEIGVTGKIIREPSSSAVRGGEEIEVYRFEVSLDSEGFIHILNLDKKGKFSFIYPFLREKGWNDFGVKGSLPKGERHLIPPESYDGYEPEKDGDLGFFYIIPCKIRIEEAELRKILGELEKEKAERKEVLPELSERLYEWLKGRYPGTILKRFTTE